MYSHFTVETLQQQKLTFFQGSCDGIMQFYSTGDFHNPRRFGETSSERIDLRVRGDLEQPTIDDVDRKGCMVQDWTKAILESPNKDSLIKDLSEQRREKEREKERESDPLDEKDFCLWKRSSEIIQAQGTWKCTTFSRLNTEFNVQVVMNKQRQEKRIADVEKFGRDFVKQDLDMFENTSSAMFKAPLHATRIKVAGRSASRSEDWHLSELQRLPARRISVTKCNRKRQ